MQLCLTVLHKDLLSLVCTKLFRNEQKEEKIAHEKDKTEFKVPSQALVMLVYINSFFLGHSQKKFTAIYNLI